MAATRSSESLLAPFTPYFIWWCSESRSNVDVDGPYLFLQLKTSIPNEHQMLLLSYDHHYGLFAVQSSEHNSGCSTAKSPTCKTRHNVWYDAPSSCNASVSSLTRHLGDFVIWRVSVKYLPPDVGRARRFRALSLGKLHSFISR